MIYSDACYAPGASEPGNTPASPTEALQRAGYYSRPMLAGLGASAYFATDRGASPIVSGILSNPNLAYGAIYNQNLPGGMYVTNQSHPLVAGDRVYLGRRPTNPYYTYAFAGDPFGVLSTSGVTADVTPPTLTAVSPYGSGVVSSATVNLAFSEPVANVSQATVRLTDLTASSAVAASVSYDPGTRSAVLTPTDPLAAGHTYAVDVSSWIADLADNRMAARSWTFVTAGVTADVTPPTLTAVSPYGSGVVSSATVNLAFSEPVANVSQATVRLTDLTASSAVAASVSYDPGTRSAVLTPTDPLAAGHTYAVDVSSWIADLADNRMAARSWTFVTAGVTADVTPPTLTAVSPYGSGVVSSATVNLAFSEPVANVSQATVRLTDLTASSAVAASVSYDPGTRSAVLTPTDPLAAGHTYAVDVSSWIADLADNRMAARSWTFVTVGSW